MHRLVTSQTTTPPGATTAARRSVARTALVLASMGFFLITLDILIVNVALPRVGAELGGTTAGLQWVIDGYTLFFAALLLLGGNLSDRLGARRAMTIGTAGFLVASIACALAPTLGFLVGARAVQGATAALMLPASMALVREAYPDARERARALGIWAVGGAVAGTVGPVAGGLLTTLDWRLVFGINLPVCIAVLVLLARLVPSAPRPRPFDWTGQVLSLLALGGLVFGLIEGGAQGFGSPEVLVAVVVSAASLVAFVVAQARVRHPMMPLDLFRSGPLRIALGTGLAFMVGNFGSVFVLSLLLQHELGLSPLLAGLLFLPSSAVSIVGNIVSGPIVNRAGPALPMAAGLLSMTAGLALMAVAAPSGSIWAIVVCTTLVFAGGSVSMPPATSVVLANVPAERAGIASAVFNTFRQVGGAVAIAVFGALVASSAGFVPGAQVSFVIAAGVGLVAAGASVFVRSDRGSKTTTEHPRERIDT